MQAAAARSGFARALAPLLALALAGCGGNSGRRSADALPDSVEVIARGNEPFWGVQISHQGIVFREPENIDGLAFPYLPPAVEYGRRVFRSTQTDSAHLTIEVAVEKKPCSDGMSGEPNDFTAAVQIGSRRLRGCAIERRAGAMGIDRRWLLDAEYPSDLAPGGKVKLIGGAYQDTTGRLHVSLVRTTEGDLDRDGIRDAAALVAANGGGDVTFMTVVAMLNREGRPVPAGDAELGDRVKVDTLYVSDETLVVRLTEHGPRDPMCCPTRPAVRRFVIRGERLEELK